MFNCFAKVRSDRNSFSISSIPEEHFSIIEGSFLYAIKTFSAIKASGDFFPFKFKMSEPAPIRSSIAGRKL